MNQKIFLNLQHSHNSIYSSFQAPTSGTYEFTVYPLSAQVYLRYEIEVSTQAKARLYSGQPRIEKVRLQEKGIVQKPVVYSYLAEAEEKVKVRLNKCFGDLQVRAESNQKKFEAGNQVVDGEEKEFVFDMPKAGELKIEVMPLNHEQHLSLIHI